MKVKVAQDLVLVVHRTRHSPTPAKIDVESATTNLLKPFPGTPQPEDLLDLSENVQGVIFGFDDTRFFLASDRFGTVPIYCFQTPTRFVFSTNLAAIFEHVEAPLNIDRVAMWESLLLDMPLGTKTLFEEIHQIDPGVMIVLNYASWTTSETNYYNFTFPSVPTQSIDKSTDNLIEALRATLQKMGGGPFLLPLSGGIDSRLLAAALCDIVSLDEIHAVTFAFGKLSLEWRLAKEVCSRLGIKRHTFYPISPECYTAVLPDFAERFGGVVSIYHAHLYSFLLSSPGVQDQRLVSGMFADAAAGYGSVPPEKVETKPQDSGYYALLEYWNEKFSVPYMPDITEDFENIFRSWQSGASISSFSEYMYVSQRQQKLLFPLVSMYRALLPVEMSYASPAVANTLFAMPYDVRQFKDGIRRAIAKLSPNLAGLPDLSSKPRLATWRDQGWFWSLRLWHWITMAGAMATRDHLDLPDFWRTENPGLHLRTCYRDLLLSSIKFSEQVGLLSMEQAKILRARSYDTHFECPQYRIITLAHLIKHLRNKGLLSI
jgi:hypothetical protein